MLVDGPWGGSGRMGTGQGQGLGEVRPWGGERVCGWGGWTWGRVVEREGEGTEVG